MKNLDLIRCKDCQFYQQDYFSNLFGIPIIVAHHICDRHETKLVTDPEGFCYLARPRREEEGLTGADK